jgi:hypothetical protein
MALASTSEFIDLNREYRTAQRDLRGRSDSLLINGGEPRRKDTKRSIE